MSKYPIYTIGHGARSLSEFIDLLKKFSVKYLIDVRSSPYSKFKPEFNKAPLDIALKKSGITYAYMGDTLGGLPADSSMLVNGKFDYSRMAQVPEFKDSIKRLITAHDSGHALALMCSEGKPEQCHRTKLIGEVLSQSKIPVIHIDETGANIDHQGVIDRITGGQTDLFGNFFTSNKRLTAKDIEGVE